MSMHPGSHSPIESTPCSRMAKTAMREIFDANPFGHILAIHWIVRGGEREGDKQTHAFVVVGTTRKKVNSLF